MKLLGGLARLAKNAATGALKFRVFGGDRLHPLQLAANQRGDALLLLADDRVLYASAYTPETGFGEPVVLDLPTGRSVAAATVALDAAGRAVVACVENAVGAPPGVWTARFVSGRWSAREPVSREIATSSIGAPI